MTADRVIVMQRGMVVGHVFRHPKDVSAWIDREIHLEAIKTEDEQNDVAE